MKKTTKNIIIALAVLLVLGIAMAVLLLTEPKPETEPETSAPSAGFELMDPIIDNTPADYKKIELTKSENGEVWTMIPIKGTENSEENDAFTFEGWEDQPVMNSNVTDIAYDFYYFRPTKEIENVDDLAAFGLSGDGLFKVVATLNDGSTDTFLVGHEAGETYGRYVLYEDHVYILPISLYITRAKTDFISTSVLTIPNMTDYVTENGIAIETLMSSIRFSGTNYPEEVLIQYSDDAVLYYEMSEPIFTGANTTRIDEIIAQLQDLKADAVAAVNVTDEELKVYGLDEPSTVIDFELNFEKHQLRLGSLVKGMYSLMIDDNKTVYMVSEDTVSTWCNPSLFDLRDGFIRLPNIKGVKKLTVTSAEGTETYDAKRIKNEEKSTEKVPFYDLEITRNGKAVDYDTMYQPFYQSILSVYVMNEELREPQGEPVFTVRYEYYDDQNLEPEEVSFYKDPQNDRQYIATFNGQASAIVRASNVEEVLTKKALIASNQVVEKD